MARQEASRQDAQGLAVDLARLPKLLARLDSDQEAEVLAAARAASRLLRTAGLGWDDVVAAAPARGWRSVFDLGRLLAAETRRRVAAERAAHHWQTLARLREAPVSRAPATTPTVSPDPAPPAPESFAVAAEASSGHPLIDALLTSPALNAAQRMRVEAIASWYRRSGELLETEMRDLTDFGQQAGLLPQPEIARVAA